MIVLNALPLFPHFEALEAFLERPIDRVDMLGELLDCLRWEDSALQELSAFGLDLIEGSMDDSGPNSTWYQRYETLEPLIFSLGREVLTLIVGQCLYEKGRLRYVSLGLRGNAWGLMDEALYRRRLISELTGKETFYAWNRPHA